MQIQKPYRDTRGSKYPEPVHIVIIKGPDGVFNAMSAAWVMFTSIEPTMLAVSIGFERYTYELFKQQDEFVISIPSETMLAEIEFFGSQSGRDMDKLGQLGTLTEKAHEIDGLLLNEASLNYECRVTGSLRTGDHVIFAGEVVASHIHEPPLPRLYLLGPGKFGGIRPVI